MLKILRLKGKDILPFIAELAKLRMQIFKNYPYLYEGDIDYETNYLNTYTASPEAVMVVVIDQGQVVGCSTAIPLQFETKEFQQPFIDHERNIHEIFYLGESVLLPTYRGKNLYRKFFHEREAAALDYGSAISAFCAVERNANDPRCPKDYVALDPVWEHFGYQKHPELRAYFSWREIGETAASKKPLVFWLKKLT